MSDEDKGSGGDGEAGGYAAESGRGLRAYRPVHTIAFTIPFVPSKGRPRFRSMGKYMIAYTPKKTLDQEATIRQYFLLASRREPVVLPWKGLVAISIHATRGASTVRPKSERRAMNDAGLECLIKPDWDNIGKIISDALNGVCWDDDAQIWFAQVEKRYGRDPATTVRIVLSE